MRKAEGRFSGEKIGEEEDIARAMFAPALNPESDILFRSNRAGSGQTQLTTSSASSNADRKGCSGARRYYGVLGIVCEETAVFIF